MQAASVKDKLLALENRKAGLVEKLKECPGDDTVIDLHPGAIEHHLKSIAELRSSEPLLNLNKPRRNVDMRT